MFEKRKAEKEMFQIKLMNCKNEKERDTSCASETSSDAHNYIQHAYMIKLVLLFFLTVSSCFTLC